jgi:inositol monophosphatase 3
MSFILGYKTLEVIKGNADAYTHVTRIKKWDICAGNAVLSALDGVMTTLDGTHISYLPTQSEINDQGLLSTLDTRAHYKYLEKLTPVVQKARAEKEKEKLKKQR